MRLKFIIITAILIFIANYTFAQGVAINADGSSANSSSMLDVKSANKGLLIPRVALNDV